MEKLVCNGIDVTECTLKCGKDCALYYAQLNSDNKNLDFGYLCQDNPDCYYKQLARLNNQCEKILEQNRDLQAELIPFRDSYFRGLSMGTVAELAKTELRNIAANQELVHKLDKIKDIAEEYKSYNRTGFEEILKIIESEDNNEQS